jgi:hypothetical protein
VLILQLSQVVHVIHAQGPQPVERRLLPDHQRADPRQARRPGERGMKGVVGGVEGDGIAERDRVALGRDRNA